jgi:uncharacterized caspase-like protein
MRLALVFLLPVCAFAAPIPRRLALLIGINDYSAAGLPPSKMKPGRSASAWKNLDGAVNDVEWMRELLLLKRYGFAAPDVALLKNGEATRAAILRELARLAKESKRGDVVFFHYSGHGSQVPNSKSREGDHYDESIVPADSRRGALDIRDKELRDAFNAILDTGARLTVVMDSCHSGSGARGLDDGARYRAVPPDSRDAADPSTAQPPEMRGALVLSAAQEFQPAYETKDRDGIVHGAFSWALEQSMRDAEPGESASDIFLRAQARLRNNRAGQDPVIAGSPEVQLGQFLGERNDSGSRHDVIAVQRVASNGTVFLDGGWVNGVTAGSELRLVGNPDVRLEVTSVPGIASAEARLVTAPDGANRLEPGALLEMATWAPPPGRPLHVWIPSATAGVRRIAQTLRDDAMRRGIRWIDDPTEQAPTALLRWVNGNWQLLTPAGSKRVGARPLAAVRANASLFVELPASAQLVEAIGSVDGVDLAPGPESADYILAGRVAKEGIEYAWVRPQTMSRDAARNALPARTAWTAAGPECALKLREFLRRLRLVHGWHDLASPGGRGSPYRLTIRTDDGKPVENATLVGGRQYQLVLRAKNRGQPVYARYLYVFVIDSAGNRILLFPNPESGSVEHRLPLTDNAAQPLRNPPDEIALSTPDPVVVEEPYGADTYFLLSTDEHLSSLASLQSKGVRSPAEFSPIEELLVSTSNGTRGRLGLIRTPLDWSIDKVVFESVAPSGRAR